MWRWIVVFLVLPVYPTLAAPIELPPPLSPPLVTTTLPITLLSGSLEAVNGGYTGTVYGLAPIPPPGLREGRFVLALAGDTGQASFNEWPSPILTNHIDYALDVAGRPTFTFSGLVRYWDLRLPLSGQGSVTGSTYTFGPASEPVHAPERSSWLLLGAGLIQFARRRGRLSA